MKVVILGSGPSGLIAANYLTLQGIDFSIVSNDCSGFAKSEINGSKFYLGQRTLFHHKSVDKMLSNLNSNYLGKELLDTINLSDKIGVLFDGKTHCYPIQNNLSKIGIIDKLKIYGSYLFRNSKLAKSDNYASWVKGVYGSWLADNIILPHTWKTLKEDLYTIQPSFYGKKVVPIKIFGEREPVYSYRYQETILKLLKDNVSGNHVSKEVKIIDMVNKVIQFSDGDKMIYDVLINSIALPKFLDYIETFGDGLISVTRDTLKYNNMMIVGLLVPTDFINTDFSIVYFPERDYTFSKAYFQESVDGFTMVTLEISFRDTDKRINNHHYMDKVYDTVEHELKSTGLISDAFFLSYKRVNKVLSPAYIICDREYESNNTFIQRYLEHNDIFNIGRFAMWKPWMRVEHSVDRAAEIFNQRFVEPE